MCKQYFRKYTCGCQRKEQFVQCDTHRGTILQCARTENQKPELATNYCSQHLVKADRARFDHGKPETNRVKNETEVATETSTEEATE